MGTSRQWILSSRKRPGAIDYGGPVNAKNVGDLVAQDDIDDGLVVGRRWMGSRPRRRRRLRPAAHYAKGISRGSSPRQVGQRSRAPKARHDVIEFHQAA